MAGSSRRLEKTYLETRLPRGFMTPFSEVGTIRDEVIGVTANTKEYEDRQPAATYVVESLQRPEFKGLDPSKPAIRLFDLLNHNIEFNLPAHAKEELQQERS